MRQLNKKEIKKFLKKPIKRDVEICLVLENLQYAVNVASLFRTADAAAVRRVYLTGISHQPPFGKDLQKTSRHKEDSVEWVYKQSTTELIEELKKNGFKIIAIELTDTAKHLFELPEILEGVEKICFVAGSEVYGVNKKTLEKCDESVYIPMYGKGASLNVSQATAIVLFSF
mgnify:CR=1 FL=1